MKELYMKNEILSRDILESKCFLDNIKYDMRGNNDMLKICDIKSIAKQVSNISLDFCFDDKILTLYRRLCKYYWDINPLVTADYIEYYRDMHDSGVV